MLLQQVREYIYFIVFSVFKIIFYYFIFSTVELEQMLEQEQNDLSNEISDKLDEPFDSIEKNLDYELKSHRGSGSGGYADFIINYAAKKLFDINNPKLEYKIIKNSDFQEIILRNDDKILLHFAITNGFRNIQNLVQKLKREKCVYHYVEVMACPAGKLKQFCFFFFL